MGIFCGRGKIGYLVGHGALYRLRSSRSLKREQGIAVKMVVRQSGQSGIDAPLHGFLATRFEFRFAVARSKRVDLYYAKRARHAGRTTSIMSTKTVFTTGEAAKICKVSQQTIIRCFDNGSLKGFRVPGSRFRRIPREQLYTFMKDNGIPTDALESGKKKLLIVDDDEDLVELISEGFQRDGRFEIRTADNGFDAGMGVKEFRPDLVVLDVMLPDINGKEVCHRVRSDSALDSVKILCISGMVEQDKVEALKHAGANDFMQKPFAVEELLDRACDLLDIERSSAVG